MNTKYLFTVAFHRFTQSLAAVCLLLCSQAAWAGELCNTTALAIPDNNGTGITRPVTVLGANESISDLDVSLSITHPNVGDLDVSLQHVATATTVKLIERPSSSSGNCTADNFPSIILDDEGSEGSVQDSANCIDDPTSKVFTPHQPLSAFNGSSVNGAWNLVVRDLSAGQTGSFESFCVRWNSTDLELLSAVSAHPVPGNSNFVHTLTVKNNGPFSAKDVNLVGTYIPSVMGVEFVGAYTSKGALGVSGLPFAASLQVLLGDLGVNETASVDVELKSYGVPTIPSPASPLVRVNSPETLPFELFSYPYSYGIFSMPASGVSGNVVLVQDGSDDAGAGSFNDACQALTNAGAVNGNIALVMADLAVGVPPLAPTPTSTPACSIETQVNNAVAAGAAGVIAASVYDHVYSPFPPPPSAIPGVSQPVIAIGKLDYTRIVQALNAPSVVNVTMAPQFARQWWSQSPAFASLSASPFSLADTDPSNNLAIGLFAYSQDKDKDNAPDSVERCPNDPKKSLAGQCGCGTPDTDSDSDGIAACNDNCPGDSNKIAPGVCGCGVADKDSDNDGTLDCNDQCPGDSAKTTPGVCGCGIADVDSNADSILDCNVTQQFQSLAQQAAGLMAGLLASKKKSKAERAQLNDLKEQLLSLASGNVGLIKSNNASADLVNLSKKAKRKIQKALRAKKKSFKKAKKRAAKALADLLAHF